MRHMVLAAGIALATLYTTGVRGEPYTEMTPRFDRIKSNTMVRKIAQPTRANLDYAAYTSNPVLFDVAKMRPEAPDEEPSLEKMTFNGMVSDVCNSLDETPLTKEEKAQPLAWTPLNKMLWEVVKDPAFQDITSKVNGYKWADPDIYQAYQEIVAAWLHGEGADTEIWVRIEFKPWVTFVRGTVTDEDEDDFHEVYGLLNTSSISEDVKAKAFAWIREDYAGKELNRQQIVDWITELASYWYPTKNTDILEAPEGENYWPNSETERRCARKMRDVRVDDPVAIVRGRPYQKPIYNVYVVEGLDKVQEETGGETAVIADKKMDTSVSQNFTANSERFAQEAEAHGGYDSWAAKQKPYLDAQKAFLETIPENQMGFEGKNDWVFFRKSLEYTTGGDLADQADDKNAIPHLTDMKAYCDANNVNLLYVVVPVKSEVYFEHLPCKTPQDKTAIVNPYSRKILRDVQEAGIEVIDLLPDFLAAKADDANHDEALYQKQDTHWTNRGLQIAATKIAGRIKQYAWYAGAAENGVTYSAVDTSFERQGDIVDKLPEDVQSKYPAVTVSAQQVREPDGTPYKYKGRKDAPIILMGDSFTGVFEAVDCKSAGPGSHIALQTSLPTEVLTSWGGGPLIRDKMIRARDKYMGSKRCIVYMMVARDLYNYPMGWKKLKVK